MPRIWIIAFIFLITGCAARSGPGVLTTMGSKIKGEYYLQGEKYDQGVAEFQERVAQTPSDAAAHYYLGRFYLIQKKRPLPWSSCPGRFPLLRTRQTTISGWEWPMPKLKKRPWKGIAISVPCPWTNTIGRPFFFFPITG